MWHGNVGLSLTSPPTYLSAPLAIQFNWLEPNRPINPLPQLAGCAAACFKGKCLITGALMGDHLSDYFFSLLKGGGRWRLEGYIFPGQSCISILPTVAFFHQFSWTSFDFVADHVVQRGSARWLEASEHDGHGKCISMSLQSNPQLSSPTYLHTLHNKQVIKWVFRGGIQTVFADFDCTLTPVN